MHIYDLLKKEGSLKTNELPGMEGYTCNPSIQKAEFEASLSYTVRLSQKLKRKKLEKEQAKERQELKWKMNIEQEINKTGNKI